MYIVYGTLLRERPVNLSALHCLATMEVGEQSAVPAELHIGLPTSAPAINPFHGFLCYARPGTNSSTDLPVFHPQGPVCKRTNNELRSP